MTIEFEIESLTPRARMLLLVRANQWGCTPAEAMARIFDEAAKRAKITPPTGPDAKQAA